MRRTLVWLLLAASPAVLLASAPESYYLVLRDGSWVRAADRPTVEDGIAQVRLPNGLLALVEAERIDWRVSDDRSRNLAQVSEGDWQGSETMPQPKAKPPQTLTIVNPPAEQGGQAPAGAEATPAAAGDEGVTPMPTGAEQAASLRARISTLDAGIAELQGRQRDLQREAAGSYNLDQAEKLRAQARDLDAQIARLRSEKEQLLRQLWNIQQR